MQIRMQHYKIVNILRLALVFQIKSNQIYSQTYKVSNIGKNKYKQFTKIDGEYIGGFHTLMLSLILLILVSKVELHVSISEKIMFFVSMRTLIWHMYN